MAKWERCDRQDQGGPQTGGPTTHRPAERIHRPHGANADQRRDSPRQDEEGRGVHRGIGEDVSERVPSEAEDARVAREERADQVEIQSRVVEEVWVEIARKEPNGSPHDLHLVRPHQHVGNAEVQTPEAEQGGESDDGGQ